MSYCRWSSDDYQCDIYCYEHVDGYIEIWVADGRHNLESGLVQGPMPQKVELTEDNIMEYVQRQVDMGKYIDTCVVERIGLPYDGHHFRFDDKAEAADMLEELKKTGYNVPQHAIDALREEADLGS